MSNEQIYIEIGKRLEAIQTAFSRLNQKDWAEKHGFAPSTYNNWVKGIRRIPVDNAEVLCELYGVDLDYIYRGKIDGLSMNALNALSLQRPSAATT